MEQTKITTGGRKIALRGLTRREVRQLVKDGINPAALPMNRAEEAMDRVLGLVVTPEDSAYLDDQINADSVAVYRRIMDLTYGGTESEKN